MSITNRVTDGVSSCIATDDWLTPVSSTYDGPRAPVHLYCDVTIRYTTISRRCSNRSFWGVLSYLRNKPTQCKCDEKFVNLKKKVWILKAFKILRSWCSLFVYNAPVSWTAYLPYLLRCWSMGTVKYFHPTLPWLYLAVLGLKLVHVNENGPSNNQYMYMLAGKNPSICIR